MITESWDIPGNELPLYGIRIKYFRNCIDGTVKNTLAFREVEGRIHFGIAKYNPNDKKEKIQPNKAQGRKEAIRKLFEAEKNLSFEQIPFGLDSSGLYGCCDKEIFNIMIRWFELQG